MKWIEWGTKHDTGHAGMDHGHHKLVDIVNQLANGMETNKSQEYCSNLLQQFIDETKIHFRHEEQLMDQLQFPGSVEHKALHAMLIKDVLAFKGIYDAGQDAEFMTLLVILDSWLNRDIMVADKQLADFAAAAG